MEPSEKQSLFSGRNLAIMLILLAAALGMILFSLLSQGDKTPAGILRITVNGQFYADEPLGRERDVEIVQADGKRNVIHLTENGFYMQYSTCDNQLCVQMGTVTVDNYYLRALQNRVLCLPNGVSLELVLTDRTPVPDLPDM